MEFSTFEKICLDVTNFTEAVLRIKMGVAKTAPLPPMGGFTSMTG